MKKGVENYLKLKVDFSELKRLIEDFMDIPNYRDADRCDNCIHGKNVISDREHVKCIKYDRFVKKYYVCDSYDSEVTESGTDEQGRLG